MNLLIDSRRGFKENDIELYGINENPNQSWSDSPKAYANYYLDDAAIGCPLIYPEEGRPYVDWIKIREILEDMNII